MTIGISGSGKSTWVEKRKDNYVIVCPDQIRKEIGGYISNMNNEVKVWKLVEKRVVKAIKKNQDVILDSTMCKSEKRKEFLEKLPGNCMKIAKVFNIDLEDAQRRVRNDILNNLDRSYVPMEIIEKQFLNFTLDYDKINTDGFDFIC
jgi:predicted kinase